MSFSVSPGHKYSAKEDLARAAKLILVNLWLTTPFWFFILRALPPKFSVKLEDATGLDALPEQEDAPSSTSFHITLHAVNRRQDHRCYRHGEAAVLYAGHTVATGRTPAFCVGAKQEGDVPVVAWADGIGLPWSLRERMAADWRAGALELEIDVRLFRGDDGSARPSWMSCKVSRAGEKKPSFTPCEMFALQGWASDLAPRWMQ